MPNDFVPDYAYCSNQWALAQQQQGLGQAQHAQQRMSVMAQLQAQFQNLVAHFLPGPSPYITPQELALMQRQMQIDVAHIALEQLPEADFTHVVASVRRDQPRIFAALKAAVDAEAQIAAQIALDQAREFVPVPVAAVGAPAPGEVRDFV